MPSENTPSPLRLIACPPHCSPHYLPDPILYSTLTHTHTYTDVAFQVLSLSIVSCEMDKEVSTERTFTLDQIVRSQIDPDVDTHCWELPEWRTLKCWLVKGCDCDMSLCGCLSVVTRLHEFIQMEVKSCRVHEASTSTITSRYLLQIVWLSTHIQVKRSDSSMFAHFCCFLFESSCMQRGRGQ